MADRQDLDALMMGALYGELDAADRARLEVHLSNHPDDRAALEALDRTRGQVRKALAEVPEAEPPAGLSALLLREAASYARGAGGGATAAEPVDGRDGLWTRMTHWLRTV